jgi:hypothetical protein
MHKKNNKCIQNFGWKSSSGDNDWKTRHRQDYNIQTNVIDCEYDRILGLVLKIISLRIPQKRKNY